MKKIKVSSGQSLVEFALIFPVLFLLITGFFDLGRAVLYKSTLTNAVREAARYAIVHKTDLAEASTPPTPPDTNQIQRKVMEKATGMTISPEKIIVTVSKVGAFFEFVKIEATYQYKPVTPGMNALLGEEGFDIYAYSKMYVAPGSK